MSQIEKAGNFALFINFCICTLYIIMTWDGTGNIAFVIPEDVPFGSSRVYNISIFGLVITIVGILMVIVGILGIQIFGSGLQDSAVQYMSAVLSKVIIYVITSIFTYSVLAMVGSMGMVVYWMLTFFFAVGLIESMFYKGNGGNN